MNTLIFTRLQLISLITVTVALIGLSLLMHGCAMVYHPNTAPAPLFTQAGEVQAAGFYGTTGIDGQIALSPADNIALAAAGAYGEEKEEGGIEMHRYGELALGYYMSGMKNLRVEAFAGFGMGSSRSYLFDFSPVDTADRYIQVEGDYQRYLIQIDGGYALAIPIRGQKWIAEGGIIQRIAYVRFTRHQEEGEEPTTPGALFFEPSGFMRIGVSAFQVELQSGFAVPMQFEAPAFDWTPFYFAVGLRVALNKMIP